jgi:hypothetical protein
LQPLDDHRRRRLLTLSAMLCAVPVFLAPLAGRSSFELASEKAAFNTRFSNPSIPVVWNAPPVTVARDPFEPDGADILKPTGDYPAPPDGANVVGMRVQQGQSMGFVLPANRGASGTPVQDAVFSIPTVRAIVTGASSRALIEENGETLVVGIGDVVTGSPIVSVDSSGIRLKNGTVFALTEERP